MSNRDGVGLSQSSTGIFYFGLYVSDAFQIKVVQRQLLFAPFDACPTEVYILLRQETVELTRYGGRVYDVVH